MTNLQRIGNLIFSLLLIASGIALLLEPQGGLLVIACVMSVALFLYGVGKLVYYLTMARHMVGGLAVLFIAVIALDFSMFAIAVFNSPKIAVALYLISLYAINGALSIGRGIESRMFGSPWIMHIVLALVDFSLASMCVTFINSDETIIWVFCIGLFYTAVVRLVSVFKPTEIIYIQ